MARLRLQCCGVEVSAEVVRFAVPGLQHLRRERVHERPGARGPPGGLRRSPRSVRCDHHRVAGLRFVLWRRSLGRGGTIRGTGAAAPTPRTGARTTKVFRR